MPPQRAGADEQVSLLQHWSRPQGSRCHTLSEPRRHIKVLADVCLSTQADGVWDPEPSGAYELHILVSHSLCCRPYGGPGHVGWLCLLSLGWPGHVTAARLLEQETNTPDLVGGPGRSACRCGHPLDWQERQAPLLTP